MRAEPVDIAELLDGGRGTRQRSEDGFDARPVLRIAHLWVSFPTWIVSEEVPDPRHGRVIPHDEASPRARALLQFPEGGLEFRGPEARLAPEGFEREQADARDVRMRA